VSPDAERVVDAVVLDIEGTTTPIAFVYEELFPFARERLEQAVARAGEDDEIAAAVERLRAEHEEERRAGVDLADFDGAGYARWLMDEDRKSPGLKALQGRIWLDGYRAGELRGRVFDDVPDALRAWRDAGLRLRVYSSGSVLAQKLLFSTTPAGDLTGLFEGFHDTSTGPKLEPASYRAIADAFGLPPERVLFLSDHAGELDAARAAGLVTLCLERPGNAPPPVQHGVVKSFQEIRLNRIT
jgi:enolase-phosphatase E1